jgi:hypothetical protein
VRWHIRLEEMFVPLRPKPRLSCLSVKKGSFNGSKTGRSWYADADRKARKEIVAEYAPLRAGKVTQCWPPLVAIDVCTGTTMALWTWAGGAAPYR